MAGGGSQRLEISWRHTPDDVDVADGGEDANFIHSILPLTRRKLANVDLLDGIAVQARRLKPWGMLSVCQRARSLASRLSVALALALHDSAIAALS